MNDYEQIFRILDNISMLSIESGNPNISYNVEELRKLLDKFVLWKKENIKFQSSLEPGPAVFQYTLKAWFTVEQSMILNSNIINNKWKETVLPELKDYLINHIEYKLKYDKEERNKVIYVD